VVTDDADEPRSDLFIVIVHLPQPVDAVSRLLNAVADLWPAASIDVSKTWKIEIPADDR
jgi:hypothetical protein